MTIHVVQGADGLARRAFTADDVRRMVDAGIMSAKEPVELIEGELIAMPAEKFAHAHATIAIARKLFSDLPGQWTIGQEKSLQLSRETLVEPDFFVCPSGAVQSSEEGFLTVSGEDLFVIEVADSTLLSDRTRKAGLYARYRVREYWIIDLNGRRILVHRRPEQGSYHTIETFGADEAVSPAPPGPSFWPFRLADLD